MSFLILVSFCALLCLGAGVLRSSDELTNHCYHFPAKDYGKDNNVKTTYGSSPQVMVEVGDLAIDFTLPSNTGEMVTLSELLKVRAVLLIWGHYTCPAFQGYKSDTTFIGSSYEEEKDLLDDVKDKITLVHLIGPEPHPIWPYANFDSGTIRMNYWSTISQPQTYSERLSISAAKVLPYLHSNAILLIDYLDGPTGAYNNPVWCSYANAARAAILIGQDGVVKATQSWFARDEMQSYIKSEL
jgi:hypothetical protein